MVFWQNVKMSSTDYELNGRELIVRVPREAGLMKRSYMRIIASEGEKISNDLLIPLEYKRVLSDISNNRTYRQDIRTIEWLIITCITIMKSINHQ